MLAAVYLLQDKLLYFPARASIDAMSADTLRPWPAADDFRGLVAEPAGTARATAVVFHGNAGHAGHRTAYAAALTRLGIRVVLAEYPGYGPRGGIVGERSLVDIPDALGAVKRADGSYILTVENNWKNLQIVYRIPPQPLLSGKSAK